MKLRGAQRLSGSPRTSANLPRTFCRKSGHKGAEKLCTINRLLQGRIWAKVLINKNILESTSSNTLIRTASWQAGKPFNMCEQVHV